MRKHKTTTPDALDEQRNLNSDEYHKLSYLCALMMPETYDMQE